MKKTHFVLICLSFTENEPSEFWSDPHTPRGCLPASLPIPCGAPPRQAPRIAMLLAASPGNPSTAPRLTMSSGLRPGSRNTRGSHRCEPPLTIHRFCHLHALYGIHGNHFALARSASAVLSGWRMQVMTCDALDSIAERSLHFKCEIFQHG